MTRPAVSVVMPFAGTPAQARAALSALAALATEPGDELILADNSGTAPAGHERVRVVRAAGEHSPARARNAGAETAAAEWILFLDADTEAPADLVDRFFAAPVAAEVAALAGGVVAADGATSLAGRYGAARSFLDTGAHLAHPYLPRAASANLLVRRAAFTAVGGFYEGVRAAEDTDFAWRLQRAGWRLEARPEASVVHRYRETIGGLRRQWRGYAAGRAWLGRRYEGFAPEPALARAVRRALHRPARGPARPDRPDPVDGAPAGFRLLDALLGIEELAGFALSNRPHRAPPPPASGPVQVVLVADRFPAPGDPLADYALSLAGARVEAVARPEALDVGVARRLQIAYREDDGAAARLLAVTRLIAAHPLRAVGDLVGRPAGAPALRAIAPAARRLAHDEQASVHPLQGPAATAAAGRLAALVGRPLR